MLIVPERVNTSREDRFRWNYTRPALAPLSPEATPSSQHDPPSPVSH